jgi:hypothetical protein
MVEAATSVAERQVRQRVRPHQHIGLWRL